jgi:hypothetical protein
MQHFIMTCDTDWLSKLKNILITSCTVVVGGENLEKKSVAYVYINTVYLLS